MMEKAIILRCDVPDCVSAHGPFHDRTAGEVRKDARERLGWGVSGNEDRCPTHRNPRRSNP